MSLFDKFDARAESAKIAEVAKIAGGETESKKSYTDAELEEIIEKGGRVLVWSSVIEDHMYWVKSALEAEQIPFTAGGVPAYTLAELGEIVRQEWPAEHLKRIHALKKQLNCSIEPSSGTSKQTASNPATLATPATLASHEHQAEVVYEFLRDRVVYPPLPLPDNYLTYFCEAEFLYLRYRAWVDKIAKPLGRTDFDCAVKRLFPDAKYFERVLRCRKIEKEGVIQEVHEKVDEWLGFRIDRSISGV